MWKKKKNNEISVFKEKEDAKYLIDLRGVEKIYQTDAGEFPALKGIDLQIGKGEFVSVIGKSGSGKTTLINMLTGIDRPTGGEVYMGGIPIHELNEGEMANWRGRNMGVVFQFFQLLPTLSVFQNIMLPMDFCNLYTPVERKDRAMELLSLVDIADHAHKQPSRLSGGQQQRAAIARALANDPPIIATDEPTGNLDSKTANQIFELFEKLVNEGKTILMVTHDEDLAKRASRTVIIADGEIINEYLVKALPILSHEVMLKASRQLKPRHFAPGEIIIHQGSAPESFFIVVEGNPQVLLDLPNRRNITVEILETGSFFGEIGLIKGGSREVMVRAPSDAPVTLYSLPKADFEALVSDSPEVRAILEESIQSRSSSISKFQ
jgi:ABC-type lipoprotein export system ATPase subunit